MKLRAQTTLEYMIITALAMILISVVVSMLLNASESRNSTIFTQCQAAAKRCSFDLKLNANFDCTNFCTTECTDHLTFKELFSGAVGNCVKGNYSSIYQR